MENLSLSEYQQRQPKPKKSTGAQIDPKLSLTIAAVVLIVASFFSGVAYQKSKTSVAITTGNGTTRQEFGSVGTGGGRFGVGNRTIGTVSAVSDSSITITGRSGTTESYSIISGTTVINNGQTGSISDIQSGDRVFLTLAGAGSRTVTAIELTPSFGGQDGANQQGASSSDDNSTDSTPDTSSI